MNLQQGALPKDSGKYVYVTLNKHSRDVIVKKDKLALGLPALFSRVGGLCRYLRKLIYSPNIFLYCNNLYSLFLGLTCAFFLELLEFGYLSQVQRRENQRAEREAAEAPLENGTVDDQADEQVPMTEPREAKA